jgi:protein OS-9
MPPPPTTTTTTTRALACTVTLALLARASALTDDAFVGDDAARYVVRIPKEPLEITPAMPHRRVPMTATDGTKYLCRIPERANDDEDDEGGRDGSDDGDDDSTRRAVRGVPDDDAETTKSVDVHLAPLEGKCFYYGNGDWWTYEMCHKSHIEQFHREGAARVSSYSLGRYDADATLGLERARTDADASTGGTSVLEDRPYRAHAFVGGSKCEDVGDAYRETERQSEVRFVCAEDGAEGVSSVEEPATCKYVLTFRTPLVCEVEDLRPKRPDVERIECSRVDDDAEDDDATTTTRDDADVTPVEDATARAFRDEL